LLTYKMRKGRVLSQQNFGKKHVWSGIGGGRNPRSHNNRSEGRMGSEKRTISPRQTFSQRVGRGEEAKVRIIRRELAENPPEGGRKLAEWTNGYIHFEPGSKKGEGVGWVRLKREKGGLRGLKNQRDLRHEEG